MHRVRLLAAMDREGSPARGPGSPHGEIGDAASGAGGWCRGFTRKSGTEVGGVASGLRAIARSAVRTESAGRLARRVEGRGKVGPGLAAGSREMKRLQTRAGAAAIGSGGVAIAPAA